MYEAFHASHLFYLTTSHFIVTNLCLLCKIMCNESPIFRQMKSDREIVIDDIPSAQDFNLCLGFIFLEIHTYGPLNGIPLSM